ARRREARRSDEAGQVGAQGPACSNGGRLSLPLAEFGILAAMASIELRGQQVPGIDKVLSKEALAFLESLERRFGPTRKKLLAARGRRSGDFKFLAETEGVRKGDWKVAPTPADLQKR